MAGLSSRIRRIFQLCDSVPEAILIESGTDANFRYVIELEMGELAGSSVILVPDEAPGVITSPMEEERARGIRDIRVEITRNRREHDRAIASSLGSLKRIGYNPHGLSCARFGTLECLLPEAEWVDVSPAFIRARLVKDAGEIARVREASRISALVINEVPGLLKIGMRERELAAEVNYRLQRRAAGGLAFGTIVAFGPNTSEPHHTTGEAALARGSLVLVDLGARHRGYCADLTRTFAFGEVGETAARMHRVVLEAQDAALERIVPDATLAEVHGAVDSVINGTEFAGRFLHAAGHSVGIEAQDGPGIHTRSDVLIEPGMVFAVEPGIYVPGTGGARVEDTVLVTEEGVERLTDASRALVGGAVTP